LLDRCKRAGRVALALRPGAYDAEVVYLITLLQNLGRLVVHYHYAEEAAQIRRLMQPGPPPREGESEEPGMSEEGAACAVLGTDIEALGAAVARHWGLDDSVLSLIRRLPTTTTVRAPDSDNDTLRALSSCANEAVDALLLAPARVGPALHRVVSRYGRALDFGVRELQAALQVPADTPVGLAAAAAAPLTESRTKVSALRGGR
jgi:eukaryotic-like serine/threonine-protein kinase